MKRILFAAVALMISAATFAQKQIVWFDVGLKAQYGFTGLYNKAIVDSDAYDYVISKGYGIGGKLGINFGYNGLAIDVMYSNGRQEFDIVQDETLTSTIDYKSLDVYLLYRNAKNLGYFEIGPKISFVNAVEGSISTQSGVTNLDDDFNSNAIAGVIGFGANVIGNDGRFSGILGLRFEYGFTDMVSDLGQTAEKSAPIYDESVYAEGYSKTAPIFAGVVFELNWGVGYFGKAQCGGRSKFMMF